MDLIKVTWRDPHNPSNKKVQKIRILSSVPIVVIPTDTVPIDFAMFLVSPFHRKYCAVPDKEARGFECKQLEDDEDGDTLGFDVEAANKKGGKGGGKGGRR